MESTRKRYGGQSDKDLHQNQFLEAFAVSCSVQKAARWAGVHRQTHYDWMREDATYPTRFAQARERAAQSLEDEAVRRAMEGIRRPVLYRGKQVYIQGEPAYQIEYSDQLLIRLLEANNPERFGRRHESAEVWETDPEKLTEKQLDVLLRHFMKQFVGDDPVLLNQAMKELEAGTLVVELKTDPSQPSVELNESAPVVEAEPAVEALEDDEPIADPPAAPARKKEHWEP
jgi:hypothetical protein